MIGVAACSSDPAADDSSTDAGPAKADGSSPGLDSGTTADSSTGKDSSTPVDSGVDSSISCAAAGCSADATCSDASGTAVCTCKPGFSGDGKTCSDVNECAVNPCLNGGTCVNGANAFTCTCAPGYSGTTCQTNVNECAVNPCLNGGTCVDGVNSYTCTCAPGYTGATCQTNIDECAANPCQNGGVCTDGVNDFTCACPFGRTGKTCTAYFASCYAMKTAQAAAPDGDYTIDRDGAGALAPITVSCDMTTDGGGYTSYLVMGGIATTRFDEANSCTALGMNMIIPRTHAHLDALWTLYGSKGYMQTVSGVYGLAAGNYTNCAMNSGDATCGANWVALDGGKWFARAVNFSEPNGDYTAGGWLGGYNTAYDANGMFFNDLTNPYSTGTTYVCSDNAKP